MRVGQPMSELKFQLVDATTGEPVELPARRNCWDGSSAWIDSWKPSRFLYNPGYVYDRNGTPTTPDTYGLKIVEVSDGV